MIFAFTDDNSIILLNSVEEVNTYCEASHILDGIYTFINEFGFVFDVIHIKPTVIKNRFIFKSIVNGTVDLKLTNKLRIDLLNEIKNEKRSIDFYSPVKIRTFTELKNYLTIESPRSPILL